jgi:hypothetical protein
MKDFSHLRESKEKELDEISLSHLKKKIANSGGLKQVSKANKADKLKKELEAMKKKLATEAYGDEPASEDEFRMAKKQAEFIAYVAEEIEDHLENGGNFPEWMQNMLSELHQKAVDMHSTLGAHGDEEDDEDMNEKTLTPAEKKKREEIAKAMERDNPNMPMDKKMAIATAQAKKVAEDVELDEAARRKGPPKMQGDWLKKEREANRAHDAAMGRTATGRKKPERAMTSTQRSLAKMRNEEANNKHKLAEIRAMLNKENKPVKEVSDMTKQRYINKSMDDYSHSNAVRKDAEARGDKDTAAKMKARMNKRNKGMTRAFGGERD